MHELFFCLKIVKSLSLFLSDENDKEKITTGKDCQARNKPLTGTEVVEILAKKKHLGELDFYHLKASEDPPYGCQSLFIFRKTF